MPCSVALGLEGLERQVLQTFSLGRVHAVVHMLPSLAAIDIAALHMLP